MNEPGLVTITMSMHELDRLKVVQAVCERRLNVEVVEYRDGTIEIQAAGRVLSYREYDRITQIDRGAEVDNKRLSAALAVSRLVQEQREQA